MGPTAGSRAGVGGAWLLGPGITLPYPKPRTLNPEPQTSCSGWQCGRAAECAALPQPGQLQSHLPASRSADAGSGLVGVFGMDGWFLTSVQARRGTADKHCFAVVAAQCSAWSCCLRQYWPTCLHVLSCRQAAPALSPGPLLTLRQVILQPQHVLVAHGGVPL